MVDVHSRGLVEAAFAAGSAEKGSAAVGILEALRPATRHDAAAVLAWDSQAREHVVLANSGYEPQTLSGLGEPYAATREHVLLYSGKTALRIDDLPYDYRSTEMFLTVLGPAGFKDGMTVCTFASDGSYTGMLHVSAGQARTFDDESREMLNTLAPTVATVCDLRECRSPLPLPQDCRAALIDWLGRTWPVAGCGLASAARLSEFPDLIRLFLSGGASTAAGLLPSPDGWLEIRLERVRDPVTARPDAVLTIERPCALPYGLSPREYDVLNAVALGHANQRIASERRISVRTVASHLEQILVKLDRGSRAGASVRALTEGQLRLDIHVSR
jgi:DNA-binding CsgD family transcriptional regulator